MTKLQIGSGAIVIAVVLLLLNVFAPRQTNGSLTSSSPETASTISGQLVNDECGTYGCACKEGLSELPITAPQGMSLVDITGCTRYGDDFYGTFIFKGETTVIGVVMREDNSIFGDSVWFNAENTGGYSQFGSAIYSLKFLSDPTVIKKFKIPELSEKSSCWEADAVIKVKLLQVLSGDTDEAGNYPKDFYVLKVGQYRKCESK